MPRGHALLGLHDDGQPQVRASDLDASDRWPRHHLRRDNAIDLDHDLRLLDILDLPKTTADTPERLALVIIIGRLTRANVLARFGQPADLDAVLSDIRLTALAALRDGGR